jgi:hypothetical protein
MAVLVGQISELDQSIISGKLMLTINTMRVEIVSMALAEVRLNSIVLLKNEVPESEQSAFV